MIDPDPCQRSINTLKKACTTWLLETHQIENPVFLDDEEFLINGLPNYEIVDVVFFGSFLEKFLRSGNWNRQKFRFWVLSDAVKNLFTDLFGLAENQVSVIPRYELFPLKKADQTEKINWWERDFVYSGRISPCKNIELMISTFALLKKEHQLKTKLYIIGPHDDEVMPGSKEMDFSYKSLVEDLKNKYQIQDALIFLDPESPEQWMNHSAFTNPLLINFSTFLHEDFGVSVAQAQASGWACLVSGWGGHIDLKGDNVFTIPYQLFHHYRPEFMVGFARLLAKNIPKIFEQTDFDNYQKEENKLPATLDISTIHQKRLDFVEAYRPFLIEDYRHYEYLKTFHGHLFKRKLIEGFSRTTPEFSFENHTLILDNRKEATSALPTIMTFANEFIFQKENELKFEILQGNEVASKLGMNVLLKSQKIFIASADKNYIDSILEKLKSMGIDENHIIAGLEELPVSFETQQMINQLTGHKWLDLKLNDF